MKSERTTGIERSSGAQPGVQRFVLWPNRSLPYRGKIILLAVIATGLAIPILFVNGAMIWYLTVPAGLTFLGMLLALWSNERAANFQEIVEISQGVMRIRRVGIRGPDIEVRFNPYWAKLSLKTDRYVENRLLISESGQSYSVGEFLAPEEREVLSEFLADSMSQGLSRR